MRILILITILAGLSACQALIPDKAFSELEHVSHATAGYPVGPKCEEDGLTQAQIGLKWINYRTGIWGSMGFGVNLQGNNGGGFYGPSGTFTARVGWDLLINK